nr:M23 family metallopeptidase [Thermocrispum municipale]
MSGSAVSSFVAATAVLDAPTALHPPPEQVSLRAYTSDTDVARGGRARHTTADDDPATRPSADPATRSSADPATRSSADPATRSAADPATRSAADPATRSSADPATRSSADPATRSSARPAIRSSAGDPGTPTRGRFAWPLHPTPPVVRSFDPPDTPFGAGHRGVDLGGRRGQPVLAASAGVVVYADKLAGRGVISIEHDAVHTTYEPVRAEVKVGDQVYEGQRIGTLESGHEGCPEAACLHWGALRTVPELQYLDPLQLVRSRSVVRLKPWTG